MIYRVGAVYHRVNLNPRRDDSNIPTTHPTDLRRARHCRAPTPSSTPCVAAYHCYTGKQYCGISGYDCTHWRQKLTSPPPRHLLLFLLTCLLTLILSLNWVNAKEPEKPTPKDWEIKGIVAALADPYAGVRLAAADKLGKYQLDHPQQQIPNYQDIVKRLVKQLSPPEKEEQDEKNLSRRAAADALGQMQAKDYAANVAALLKDSDINVRRAAAEALGQMQAKDYAANVAALLKDSDINVRRAAAYALGQMQAKDIAAKVAALLKDSNSDIRSAAAYALGQMQAKDYAANVAALLKDSNSIVRYTAAEALGQMQAKDYAANVAALLKDSDINVRRAAAEALGQMQAKDYAANVAALLKDSDINVRRAAAYALGQMQAKDIAAKVAALLKDSNSDIRSAAAYALGQMQAKDYAANVAALLKDSNSIVRYTAAEALGQMQAKDYAANVAALLKDSNSIVRYTAAYGLGQMQAKDYAANVAALLKDSNSIVRYAAAYGLEQMQAKDYAANVAALLKDSDINVRYAAAEALAKLGQQGLPFIVVQVLNAVGYYPSEVTKLRFVAHFIGGGKEDIETLMQWIGKPKTTPNNLTADRGRKIMNLFEQAWKLSDSLPELRQELAEQIAVVADLVHWHAQDINLLERQYQKLKNANYKQADTVRRVIDNLEFWKWFFLARNIILIHFAIWLTFILAYPYFTQILAPLFWNPWLRQILGFGYIGLLLALVPWLRDRLFQPFKPLLLADAGLDNFVEQGYFGESFVKVPRGIGTDSTDSITPEMQPITQAIPTLQGQIVLEGESGLGKSMFLRHLVNNSRRMFVYLPAQKCDMGVMEAIFAKLRGQVEDTQFLQRLIYNGALDICIDGLNEVTADTRAKVSQFAESYFRGNLIMTTQPLEWIPPSTAKKYELQALTQEQIEQFLLLRYRALGMGHGALGMGHGALGMGHGAWGIEDENLSAATPEALNSPPSLAGKGVWGLGSASEYEQACFNYLAEAFNEEQSPEDLALAKRILANPMDLTLVALMLSQGQQPNLFRLQEQQYQLMAAEYLREWQYEFPLQRFSQAVYQMRLNDESIIPPEEFPQELISLADEKYKMVVSRQWENDKGEAQKSWYFRHDKIMEFFLVQNFRGEDAAVAARVHQHINDPRFRGVYLLLANLLPLESALELREKIIDYAANNQDHTLSDKFIQLLQLRLPQNWTQDVKPVLQQHAERIQCLDLVKQFFVQVEGKVKREPELLLTIESISDSLSSYAPFPVLITVDAPTDKDIIRLLQLAEQLPTTSHQKIGLLIYKQPPDATARIEIAKVRLRDHFLLIPIPLASVETALADKYECMGLLADYIDRYLQRADFFDDKNAISDTLSFFGRTELLQRLGEELLRSQGVGLFGLRKSGKTSVLFQLCFMLREHPIVHIDLQRYGGSRYGAALFNDILQRLSSLESEVIFPQFAPFADDKAAIELSSEFIHRVNEFALAIQKTHKYKLPILVFLDEVERIIPTPEDSREKAEEFNSFFGAMRVLCQQQRQISLLIADVHPDCNRINYWTQKGVATNPVFSFFKEIFLPPFSEAETQDMLLNLGKLMGLEFDVTTPQQIHHQSGGHPFVSRQLAGFFTKKHQENHPISGENAHTLIEWAKVERYLDKTLSQRGELKNYLEKSIWEDLTKRDFQIAITILRVVACNAHLPEITQTALFHHLQSQFTTNDCLDACNWLKNVGLLYQEEVEHEDIYHIRIPLLSRWILMQMTNEEIEQCRIL